MSIWNRINMLLRSEKQNFFESMDQGISQTMSSLESKMAENFSFFRQKIQQYTQYAKNEAQNINSENWDDYFEAYIKKIQQYWQQSFGNWFDHNESKSHNQQSYWQHKAKEEFDRNFQDQQHGHFSGSNTDKLAKHFAVLEIPPTDSIDSIKKAWKSMMRKYHPDLFHNDPQKKQLAVDITARITQAYQEIIRHISQ